MDEQPAAPADPQSALISLVNQRNEDPMNLGLRDQEHAAFSKHVLDTLGPILGPAVVAASVPAYSAAKAIAQPLGMMKGATPPSFGEVKAGLSPLWGGTTAPTAPAAPPQMPQPNPQPVDPTFANKLYTLMRMWGLLQSPDRQAQLGTR